MSISTNSPNPTPSTSKKPNMLVWVGALAVMIWDEVKHTLENDFELKLPDFLKRF